MTGNYRYIVVGRGMMGSAAARYLAEQTDGVALIGPGEPQDHASHEGVFASHYDQARITRTIDQDPDWALLANRSIARYGDIANRSGIDFYKQAGCLIVGPQRDGPDTYIGRVVNAAERLGVETQVYGDAGLQEVFPYFAFEKQSEGVFERHNAGYINPRALVKAQTLLARQAGAALIDSIVASVREEGGRARVTTTDGEVFTADRVLVAAGGFSIAENLLPQPVKLEVYARTVAFFEVQKSDLHLYASMPSLIHSPVDLREHIYLLPPVLYPDGRFYLKIGGDPDDVPLLNDADMRAWFRSGGRAGVRDHLAGIAARLIPGLDVSAVSSGACVVTYTSHQNFPSIGYSSSPHIAVLTGGCGAAAKSSDEIGRLGAQLILEGAVTDTAYETDFRPVFG